MPFATGSALRNAIHLGAQLPTMVRGFYYEGWHMAGTPTKERRTEEFLERVKCDALRGLGLDPERAVQAVFEVTCEKIDGGDREADQGVSEPIAEPVARLSQCRTSR